MGPDPINVFPETVEVVMLLKELVDHVNTISCILHFGTFLFGHGLVPEVKKDAYDSRPYCSRALRTVCEDTEDIDCGLRIWGVG